MQVLRSCLPKHLDLFAIYTILANKISRHEKKALNTEQPPFFAILGNRVSKAVSKGLIFRMFRQSEKIRKAENPDTNQWFSAFNLASLAGFEPTAFRLGGERSILLSYRDLYEIELVTITFGFELIG